MTMLLQRISEGDEYATARGFGAVESEFGNLPLRQLSYHARMLGLSVRTTIVQTYCNPFDEEIEANYIFPLEYGQAVVACEMHIAGRVVKAKLKERAEARRDYAEAIHNGYRAALMEENRPETFMMVVGNIPPGEAIQICIQTVSQLSVVCGEWTLRLPLVVAPRYTSGLPLPRAACGGGVASDTDQVPDASTVTPPTWLPGFASPVDLRLVVDLDLGQLRCRDDWTRQLKSSLHTALIDTQLDDSPSSSISGRCRLQLLPGERVNRDFILRGQVNDENLSSAVVWETNESALTDRATVEAVRPSEIGSTIQTTFAVTIVPPRKPAHAIASQVVYLLDRSGSMSGWKIAAARRGLSRLLDRLGPQDRFQLAAFDDELDIYSQSVHAHDAWIPANDAKRFEAIRWLSNIEDRGGTEMYKAVQFALHACAQNTSTEVSGGVSNLAIVLVTDGQITGEDALLRLIDSMPADRKPRMFCLGVDRAVNASVLLRLSRRTGGTFELVESEQRLDEVLARFADEIASPALTGLTISSLTNDELNTAPSNVTTLYAGRAQTIYGRYAGTQQLTLSVRGTMTDGNIYEEQLQVAPSAASRGSSVLQALWGKEQIRTLEDNLFATDHRTPSLKRKIVDCSLECGVLSRLTAFVAVDETEKVTDGRKPHSVLNSSELPEGWSLKMMRIDRTSLLRVPRPASVATPARESSQDLAPHAEDTAKKMLESKDISAEQLTEAQQHATARGLDVCAALVELQYANYESIAKAMAALTKTTYIPVRQLQIDPSILQLIPESVARESHVLPIADSSAALTVVSANPFDLETVEKLRFILNRNIQVFCGAYDEIYAALHAHYGSIEGESADSILQEFTDTQIDFTETVAVEEDLVEMVGFDAPATYEDWEIFGSSPGDVRSARRSHPAAPPSASIDSSTTRGGGKFRKLPRESTPLDANDAPIVRLVGLLFQEAVQLRATHILAQRDGDAVQFSYVINGKLVERDRAPGRLWYAILSRVKLLAKLDITRRDGIQSDVIKVTIGVRDYEFAVHATRDSFMIELPDAKQLATVPESIEQWWASVQATQNAETAAHGNS